MNDHPRFMITQSRNYVFLYVNGYLLRRYLYYDKKNKKAAKGVLQAKHDIKLIKRVLKYTGRTAPIGK